MQPDFHTLFHGGTADAVIATSPEGNILYWSASAEQIYGYASHEAVGRILSELIGPDIQISDEMGTSHAATTVGTAVYEALRRRRDGSLLYVNISTHTFQDPDEAARYIVNLERDVTHLMAWRDARMLEARYLNLLESAPDAIVIVNITGCIVLANTQAGVMFGYSPADMIGAEVETLLPERFREGHLFHRSSFFDQPRKRSMGAGLELYGRRKDGREFPVAISLSPLETDGARLVMSAIRDVTDRWKAEQKFRGLLESAPDPMVIVDGSGKIVLVNSQTESLFGYTRAELLGKPIEIFVPERYQHRHVHHRSGYFQDPNVRPMGVGLELFARRKDGTEFPVEISISPLETEEGTLVSSSIRDVTERRAFEAELQEANRQLEDASRAKDRFLATMSHELRTPLNAIIGFTGTLLMRLPGPLTSDQEDQLRTVQSSARHLLSLINDLLDLAKIESGKVELHLVPVPCLEVVREVLEQLRPLATARGLQLTSRLPAVEPRISTDRRALRQILLNLVNNAIKFTPSGSVDVQVECLSTDNGHQTEIRVTDTGEGISPEDQARLFQAFERLPSAAGAAEGTGLGLHLCRKLADLLGAEIWLDSRPGEGSTFALRLPGPAVPREEA